MQVKAGLTIVVGIALNCLCYAEEVEMAIIYLNEVEIKFDKRIPLTKEFLEEELNRLKSNLDQALAKNRLADDLNEENAQLEVLKKLKIFSRGRNIPKPNLQNYSRFLDLKNIKNKYSATKIAGFEFRDKENVLSKLKKGASIPGVAFDEKRRKLISLRRGLKTEGTKIGFPKYTFVLEGPDYDLGEITKFFDVLSIYFETMLAFSSTKVAVEYIYNISLITSKYNFKFIGDDQRWFHEGFAGIMCFGALRSLIGTEETEEFIKKYYKTKGKIRLTKSAVFDWDEEHFNSKTLQYASHRIFMEFHNRFGQELVSKFLLVIEENKEGIVNKSTSVREILRGIIQQPVLNLLTQPK